jgi:hypothetical protein
MMTANYKRLFLTGFVTGASFYAATSWILKKLKTDHKNKNDDHSNPEIPSSEPKSPLEKIDEKPTMKTAKICLVTPGYFKKYIESIQETIFESLFFSVCSTVASLDLNSFRTVQLWFGAREKRYAGLMGPHVRGSILAARVFVMPDTEEIREGFQKLFQTESNGDALDEYCDQKNEEYENQQNIFDCCYILPLDNQERTNIDRDKLQNNQINSYYFKLNKKIHKTDPEIIGVDFNNYTNPGFRSLGLLHG